MSSVMEAEVTANVRDYTTWRGRHRIQYLTNEDQGDRPVLVQVKVWAEPVLPWQKRRYVGSLGPLAEFRFTQDLDELAWFYARAIIKNQESQAWWRELMGKIR